MTKSTFHGAALLLASDPGQEQAAIIAARIAAEHFPETKYSFSLQQELPQGMRVDAYEQLSQHKQALPAGSVYLVLRPRPGE